LTNSNVNNFIDRLITATGTKKDSDIHAITLRAENNDPFIPSRR